MKNSYPLIYTVFVFLCLAIRLHFSVDISDESFYLSEIYSCWLGRRPLMDSWWASGASCFFVPFFHMYYLFFENFDGIVLYFRWIYLCSQVSLCVLLVRLLQQKVREREVWIYSASCCSFVLWSLYFISYNTFFSEAHLLAAVLLYTANTEERNSGRYFLLGIILCVGCIAYPPMILTIIISSGVIAWISKAAWKYNLCYFCIGMVVVGSCYLAYIFSTGSLDMFQSAVWNIMNSQHSAIRPASLKAFLKYVIYIPLRRYSSLLLLFVLIQCLIRYFASVTMKCKQICIIYFYLLFVVFCSIYMDRSYYVVYSIFLTSFITQLLLEYKIIYKYWIFYLFIFCGVVIYLLSSANLHIIVAIGEFAGLVVLLVLLSWKELLENLHFPSLWSHMTAMVLGIIGIAWSCYYVYGDANIGKMDAKVDYGIYRGLCTERKRKEYVENLETFLKQNICKEDNVCAISCSPYVYIMSQGRILAPYTWDAQQFYFGFTESWPLINYFNAVGDIPDVLVATDENLNAKVFHNNFYQNPKYEINKLIMERYHLVEKKVISEVNIYIWRRND